MSARHNKGGGDKDGASSALPESYRRWRVSRLGRVTDELERDLILEQCGEVAGLQVLDLGCGDGDLAVTLCRAGAEVTGLDEDPRMLHAARERQASEALSISFVRGDVNALPFADRSFDVVTAIAVLCFVPDARTAIAEMARVLKPAGRLVVGELGRCSFWAASRRIKGWLGSATWRSARFRSAPDLRELVEQAGLAVSAIRGAVFYPPVGWLAAMVASLDRSLSRCTTFGAAFITVAATRSRPTSMTCINADAPGLADHLMSPCRANNDRLGHGEADRNACGLRHSVRRHDGARHGRRGPGRAP